MSLLSCQTTRTWLSSVTRRSYLNSVSTGVSRTFSRGLSLKIKPIIVRDKKPRTTTTIDAQSEPSSAFLSKSNLGASPAAPAHTFQDVDLSDDVDRILKEAGIDVSELDMNVESNGPLVRDEEEYDESEDFSDPEYDGFDRFKPVPMDVPKDSFLGMVSIMLEASPNGVCMFPGHMRKPLLERIAKNVQGALQRYPHLTEESIFHIVQQTMVTDGPDLARTHDEAINILFPFAPQRGDVAELPGTPGRCVVSQREFLDNRRNEDLPAEDRTRSMILHYKCLHQSVQGRTLRAMHDFDIHVYRLTMAGDHEGMENLMHTRGLIDKNSGRVLLDRFEQRAIEEGYDRSQQQSLKGAGAGMQRLAALAAMPSRHGFDDASHHIRGGKMVPTPVRGAIVPVKAEDTYVNSFGEVRAKEDLNDVDAVRAGVKVKEYMRPMVVTGTTAHRLHQQLIHGVNPTEAIRAAEMEMQPSEAQLQAADSARAARAAAREAEFSGSTHTADPLPGHNATLGELRRQALQDDLSIHSEIASSVSGEASTYAQRRATLAEKAAERTHLPAQPELSEEQMEQKRKQLLAQALEEDMAEAALPAEQQAANRAAEREQYIREDQEKTERWLAVLSEEAKSSYAKLSDGIKRKYADIIIESGIGAGLPDPMLIDEAEDLLKVYPDANVMLMDAISGQWEMMMAMKEKEGDEMPENPQELQYRVLAAVASAGNHALSMDYIQEIFNRVQSLKYKDKLVAQQAAKRKKEKTVFVGSIKSGTEGSIGEDMDLPRPQKITKKQRGETLLAKAEQVFGQKAVPLEDAEEIDPEFREEVRRYYDLRDKRKKTANSRR